MQPNQQQPGPMATLMPGKYLGRVTEAAIVASVQQNGERIPAIAGKMALVEVAGPDGTFHPIAPIVREFSQFLGKQAGGPNKNTANLIAHLGWDFAWDPGQMAAWFAKPDVAAHIATRLVRVEFVEKTTQAGRSFLAIDYMGPPEGGGGRQEVEPLADAANALRSIYGAPQQTMTAQQGRQAAAPAYPAPQARPAYGGPPAAPANPPQPGRQ